MQYKFVGFVENNFVGKPTFLFSTFPTILFSLLQLFVHFIYLNCTFNHIVEQLPPLHCLK